METALQIPLEEAKAIIKYRSNRWGGTPWQQEGRWHKQGDEPSSPITRPCTTPRSPGGRSLACHSQTPSQRRDVVLILG